jgi:hypothetical protein
LGFFQQECKQVVAEDGGPAYIIEAGQNLKHQRILQSVHRLQFAMTLVPRGRLALDRNRPS